MYVLGQVALGNLNVFSCTLLFSRYMHLSCKVYTAIDEEYVRVVDESHVVPKVTDRPFTTLRREYTHREFILIRVLIYIICENEEFQRTQRPACLSPRIAM